MTLAHTEKINLDFKSAMGIKLIKLKAVILTDMDKKKWRGYSIEKYNQSIESSLITGTLLNKIAKFL